ncbi:MAG TPA: agmatinase [Clostridiaceae bacterium]|nr:agmatinase [Clostridiaceae bacterium]
MSLKGGGLTLTTKFMSSGEDYRSASVILVGVPMDFTSSFKPGSRFAPQKIRHVSVGLEEYSVYLDKSLKDVRFYDSGDLDIPFGNVDESLCIISKAAKEILDDSKTPFFIGGEHLISVPVIKSVYDKYGDDLIVIQFDAHADLRSDYLGCPNSHASAVRRLTDFMQGKRIFQFGIRSGTKEEFDYARENTNLFKFDVFQPLKSVLADLKGYPVYVTLDIDVVDPAFANGTGTPEPGGISSNEMLQTVGLLKELNIVGFDIVEVSPPYDISDRTALLAAKIIREVLMIL